MVAASRNARPSPPDCRNGSARPASRRERRRPTGPRDEAADQDAAPHPGEEEPRRPERKSEDRDPMTIADRVTRHRHDGRGRQCREQRRAPQARIFGIEADRQEQCRHREGESDEPADERERRRHASPPGAPDGDRTHRVGLVPVFSFIEVDAGVSRGSELYGGQGGDAHRQNQERVDGPLLLPCVLQDAGDHRRCHPPEPVRAQADQRQRLDCCPGLNTSTGSRRRWLPTPSRSRDRDTLTVRRIGARRPKLEITEQENCVLEEVKSRLPEPRAGTSVPDPPGRSPKSEAMNQMVSIGRAEEGS